MLSFHFPVTGLPMLSSADITAAIRFARGDALPIAIRGGGHSVDRGQRERAPHRLDRWPLGQRTAMVYRQRLRHNLGDEGEPCSRSA